MHFKQVIMSLLIMSLAGVSCNSSESDVTTKEEPVQSTATNIEEEKTSYALNGQNYEAYVVYDKDKEGVRPGILVIPEWWGLNDYTRSRAKQLAELGYAAMALDVYGDGKIGNNPDEAQKLASPYYENPALAGEIVEAALKKFKSFPQVDSTKMAAIGYCFGGFVAINAAKTGADLKGIVSFHGGLQGLTPDKEKIKAKMLICHGADDEFENPHVAEFKREMDSAGIDYTFKEYAGATHAFSNPNATDVGKKFNMPIAYNEAADKNSWEDMKAFFRKLF